MRIKLPLKEAVSYANLAVAERNRRQWLRSNPRLSEEQYALTQSYWDEQASKVVTQSLADTVAREVLA